MNFVFFFSFQGVSPNTVGEHCQFHHLAKWLCALGPKWKQMVRLFLQNSSSCVDYLIGAFWPNGSFECSHIYGMLLATSAYVVCILGVILMFIWYAPQPSCLLNIFFITWTLVLLQLMTSVSLHPKVGFNPFIVHSLSLLFLRSPLSSYVYFSY